MSHYSAMYQYHIDATYLIRTRYLDLIVRWVLCYCARPTYNQMARSGDFCEPSKIYVSTDFGSTVNAAAYLEVT